MNSYRLLTGNQVTSFYATKNYFSGILRLTKLLPGCKESISVSIVSIYAFIKAPSVFIISPSLNEKSTPVSFLPTHGFILNTTVLRKKTDFRGIFRGLSSIYTPLSMPYTTLTMTFRPAFVTSTGRNFFKTIAFFLKTDVLRKKTDFRVLNKGLMKSIISLNINNLINK
jgi:hypothetical protein